MKRAKLLLKNFPQCVTDFVFFTGKNVFSVASPDNWQNDRVYTHPVTQGSAALPLCSQIPLRHPGSEPDREQATSWSAIC